MQSEWSKNSTFQLTFSVFDYDSALYDPLDVESSIVLEGQEYIVKNCVENFDTNTKNITAWHVYNEISRIYKRSDLTLNNNQDSNTSKDQSYGVEDLLKAWIDVGIKLTKEQINDYIKQVENVLKELFDFKIKYRLND